MKKIFTTFALAALVFGSMSGKRLSPVSIDNSDCHQFPDHAAASYDDVVADDDEDTYQWGIQYNDGLLTIIWHGFIANCCPEGFTTWIDMEEDDSRIVFNARGNDDLCMCVCEYDVTSLYENVKPGHYTISFCYALDPGNEVFSAEIDITEGCDIILTKAPSGVQTISNDSSDITVSPEGTLHIDSRENATLEIYDSAGTLRTRLQAEPYSDIDITSLSKGVYIAKITIAGKTSTLRFVR